MVNEKYVNGNEMVNENINTCPAEFSVSFFLI